MGHPPTSAPVRVELAGGSLGAFLVSVPGAMDDRFRRVWLVHGGGRPAVVLEHGLKEHIRFAPERWRGKISPRRVIVISALDDESIPGESVEALHRALGQPSEVIWMSGPHVLPDRKEIIEMITETVFARIAEEDPGPEL